MIQSQPPAPERFASLLQSLQQAVASCSAGGALAGPLIVWIWNRLARTAQRFARLAARIAAGTYKPRKPYKRRPPEQPKPRKPSLTPQTFGWLMPLVPWVPMRRFWAGPAHQSLQRLLNEPDMQELIAAAPAEMARILRPLCWMLGVKPPPVLARRRRPAPKPAAPEPEAAAPTPKPPPLHRSRSPDPPPPAPAPTVSVPSPASGQPRKT